MRRITLLLLLFSVVAATGCGASEGSESPDLSENWTRVQAREGFVGSELDNPLVGFTINLPEGWRVGEGQPTRNGPSGWIAVPGPDGRDRTPVLRWRIGGDFGYTVRQFEQDERYVLSLPEVEDEVAVLHLAKPETIDEGLRVGVFFGIMPGGSGDENTPSLRIDGDSRDFVNQDLLRDVLLSVRYKELDNLPELAKPAVTPGPDWTRVSASSIDSSFSVILPPGWTPEERRGYDSRLGSFSGDGVTIEYDFGFHSSFPYSFTSKIRSDEYNPHLLWEEKIGGLTFWLVKPESPEAQKEAAAGIYVRLEARNPMGPGPHLLSAISRNLSGEQQEMVLAILRTVELE